MNCTFLQDSQLSTEVMAYSGEIFYGYGVEVVGCVTPSLDPWNQKFVSKASNTFSTGIIQGIKSPEYF